VTEPNVGSALARYAEPVVTRSTSITGKDYSALVAFGAALSQRADNHPSVLAASLSQTTDRGRALRLATALQNPPARGLKRMRGAATGGATPTTTKSSAADWRSAEHAHPPTGLGSLDACPRRRENCRAGRSSHVRGAHLLFSGTSRLLQGEGKPIRIAFDIGQSWDSLSKC
jgi:hypothetical protein